MTSDLRSLFLEGMSRATTFVSVATTDGVGGRAGVTISSMTSVSADGEAPSLLGCIHHLSPVGTAILKNRAFCANLLADDQQSLSDLFAGRSNGCDHAQRFEGLDWTAGDLGQPVLAGATAAFECRLATSLLWESHHILIGRVVSVRLSDRPGALLYGRRTYRHGVQLPAEQI